MGSARIWGPESMFGLIPVKAFFGDALAGEVWIPVQAVSRHTAPVGRCGNTDLAGRSDLTHPIRETPDPFSALAKQGLRIGKSRNPGFQCQDSGSSLGHKLGARWESLPGR